MEILRQNAGYARVVLPRQVFRNIHMARSAKSLRTTDLDLLDFMYTYYGLNGPNFYTRDTVHCKGLPPVCVF